METRKLQLLLHPLVILSLACLILNDFYWKYEYHNWLTGKLSDFTGLFVLSAFLFAFFPKYKATICFGIIVFFIWWKSPLSQPVIDLLNSLFTITFARTVDYSDYLALPVVFAPYFIKTPGLKFLLLKRIFVCLVSMVCFFAFCSTSIVRKFSIAPDLSNRFSYHQEYPTRLTHEDILRRLDSLGWNYKTDSFTIAPLSFYGGSLLIRSRDSLNKNLMVIDPSQKDTVVYVRINEWRPYIAIYNFNAGGEVFPQVNIAVNNFAKKTTILLKAVFLNDGQMVDYYERGKAKKRIRKLIERELIRKLQ